MWQGLREEWACHGADEVIDTYVGESDAKNEIGTIELIGAEHHAILHATGPHLDAVEDIPLPDGIYNLVAIEDGRIRRIDDFADRGDALAAAGLSGARTGP